MEMRNISELIEETKGEESFLVKEVNLRPFLVRRNYSLPSRLFLCILFHLHSNMAIEIYIHIYSKYIDLEK